MLEHCCRRAHYLAVQIRDLVLEALSMGWRVPPLPKHRARSGVLLDNECRHSTPALVDDVRHDWREHEAEDAGQGDRNKHLAGEEQARDDNHCDKQGIEHGRV